MEERKSLVDKIIYYTVNKPKTMIFLGLTLVALFAPGLSLFQQRYDVRIWFRPTDPNIQTLNAFERQFGNDESTVVVMHSEDGIFEPKAMKTLHQLTEQLWKVSQIIRVESLTNFNETRAEGDEIIIEPFINDQKELDADYLKQRHDKAMEHRVLPGYLVSKDGKSAMIFCWMVPTLDKGPDYQKIISDTRRIISGFEKTTPYSFYVSGAAGVNDGFREVAASDNKVILPSMLALIIFYLLFIFRSFLAMLLPLALTVMSIVVTFGGAFYAGTVYNNIHAVLPAILIAICVADAVHILTSYFQHLGKGATAKEATTKALKKNIVPTSLTSLSTCFGFLSLAYTDLAPISEMGIMAGFGTVMAWVLTMFIIGPLLVIIPFKVPSIFKAKEDKLHGHASERSVNYSRFLQKCCTPIMILTVILTAGSLYLGSKNVINSNPYKYFSSEIPIKKANDFVRENFGSSAGPELVFSSGKADGIKDPEFLRKVEKFKMWAESQPYITRTIDIIDIIKEMNQTLNKGNSEFYKIPDSQGEVAEQLFLYTMGLPQGMDINNRVTLNNDLLRMTVLWTFMETRLWLEHLEVLKSKAQELGLDMKITGKMSLFQGMMDYVVGTFIRSISSAMFLVGLMMMILFRSVKLGLLSLVPNVLPLIFGSAFMYLAGMDLNVGTALVASVCLGIAVDDTIHFLSHYNVLKKEGKSEEEIMSHIFTYTGSALVITTIILVSGFGLFVFGDFVPNVNFGLLCAMIFGSALVADVVLLPALLFQIKKIKLWPKERHTTVSTLP